MMKRIFLTIASLASAVLLLAACSAKQESNVHHLPNGDLQETTASVAVAPEFLNGQPEVVQQAYRYAAENEELLQWIPCYCGCGQSAGHRNNLNCFVKEIQEDGAVVWDDHGTRCNVCIEIAATSAQMQYEGKTAQEIRDYVDETYKSGYAEPTPTPMPS
ncbi:PCYCGC domain-containing protein [Paenibacillus sp. MSJ-34]|uniref:PCYCGC domain-containing protein n=1 Tax=Paenibacillus sp. MSJ-34 TaxID=2841529 RepID=UPI001C0FBF86|nr:PCYCGC domain-containing protein [Paenibacillus sp. MSJ-34]MBU5442350.1 PCYCGC domain-containing protein [Paenibacillus sp. MSJ-34]